MQRTLGRSGIGSSAVGMGCWAIGGPLRRADTGAPVGWGKVDDDESVKAIHRALDLGVTLFDTADVYGAGHSERVLGRALGKHRDSVLVATKFGNQFDEQRRVVLGERNLSAEYIRTACENSLRRLGTDTIDLYQCHHGSMPVEQADSVLETLEGLVSEGKVRYYGWSTDQTEGPAAFAKGEHCTAMQQQVNIFEPNAEALRACEENGLASLNRGPLAKGLLTGKFGRHSTLPEDDVRHNWNFAEGDLAERLEKLEQIKGVLTEDGRTMTQGALAWLWTHSPATIPIPGFKTAEQVEENAGAMEFDTLDDQAMRRIEQILGRA